MNRIASIVVIVFAFILSSCVGKTQREEQKATEQLNTPVAVQVPPQQPRENAEVPRERLAKLREAKIEEIKEAFLGETTGKKDPPQWRKALIGEKSGVCGLRDRYLELAGAINSVIYSDGDIGWQHVGITKEKAIELRRTAGLGYAKELANILARPYAERLEIELTVGECGDGESGLDLEDAGAVLGTIEYVLVDIGAVPEDLGKGVTAEKLREHLLTDFVARIADMREQILKNSASESDGGAIIVHLAKTAIEDWRFTPDELRLTENERNAIKLRN